jgi:preprotein translocase subunit SecE
VADKNSRPGDAVDEMFDDDDDIVEVDEQPRATATRSRKTAASPARVARTDAGPGLIIRLISNFIRFVREIAAELAKVIWPTRKELVTYTLVVVFFVSIIVSIVAGLDYLFARVMVAVFGTTG